MAYQPKSYRKFVATAATAAMVATVVAAPVGAASNFSDVPASYQAAVDYLVSTGATTGVGNGNFGTDQNIKRADAAVMIAKSLGLELGSYADAGFTDVPERAVAAVNALKAEGIISGKTATIFGSDATLTRGEMAIILQRAYDLTGSADVPFSDVSDRYAAAVAALYANDITKGVSATQFGTSQNIKRGDFAKFVYKASNADELKIVGVSALTADGRYLEVTFSQSLDSLDKSQLKIKKLDSGALVGIQDVELSYDGKTAEVTLYEVNDNGVELEANTEYVLTYSSADGDVEFVFERYAFDKEVRVVSVDSDEREVKFAGGDYLNNATLEVPETLEFDFEELKGLELNVWFNSEKEVVKFEKVNRDVKFDAVEFDGDEITLVDEDEEYDLVTGETVYFENGVKKNLNELASEYDYAKVVFNEDGDVAYVDAYTWDGQLLVEKVEDNVIYAYGEELDAEDFVIVKDGKTISVEDIKAGDVIYYNDDADNSKGENGYAEVFTKTVTGTIDAVYDSSFKVDGEVYDYTGQYLDGSDLEGMSFDYAEDLEAGGEAVTLHLDRNGDIAFVTGELGEAVTNTYSLFLTEAAYGYTSGRDELIDLEGIDNEGNEKLFNVNVADLEEVHVNGTDYETDDFKFGADKDGEDFDLLHGAAAVTGLTLDAGEVIEVTLDEDGNVIEIESIDAGKGTSAEFDSSDTYAKVDGVNKKLKSSAVVFDLTDADLSDLDADDITVTTWGELDGVTVEDAEVYYDGGEVTHILVTNDDSENTTDYTGVVTDFRTNDGEIQTITAYVDGEKVTYDVDSLGTSDVWFDQFGNDGEVSSGDTFSELGESFSDQLHDGAIVKLSVDDETGVVTGIRLLDSNEYTDANLIVENLKVTNVVLSDKEVVVSGDTYTFVNGATVLSNDAGDISVESLRDVRDIANHATKTITVVREKDLVDFVTLIIINE